MSERGARRQLTCAVDLVLLSTLRRGLAAFLTKRPRRAMWGLPSAPWAGREKPKVIAARLYRGIVGEPATWCEQSDAICDGAHPTGAHLSLIFAATVPAGLTSPDGAAWHSVSRLPVALASRQRSAIVRAVEAARARMDRAPIAFTLLPSSFTLTDAQRVYEILLDRRLHKASFRRTLLAARLVESTNAWRSEGRGRPAQLYRYAPRKRRGVAAALRFDLVVS